MMRAFIFVFLFSHIFLAQEASVQNEIVLEVERLYTSGLSQELIIQYIQSYKKDYIISAEEILYLKNKNIPEEIIKKLLEKQFYFSKPKKEEKFPKEFENLILKKGFGLKNRNGNIIVKEDKVEWHDFKNPEKNFSLKINGIKAIWMKCKPRAIENFCYEINFSTFDGKKYSFSDFNWEKGESEIVKNLYKFFKENFKEIIYQEKVE